MRHSGSAVQQQHFCGRIIPNALCPYFEFPFGRFDGDDLHTASLDALFGVVKVRGRSLLRLAFLCARTECEHCSDNAESKE